MCTNCSQHPSQPVAISPYPVLVEGNILLHFMDNAQILHAIEMTHLVDEQHSCPQTTKCFHMAHQWNHPVPLKIL